MPFATIPDLDLYYREQGPAAAETTVLFVHGSLASSRWWIPAMARLPEEWHAVAPDLRGSGRSRRAGLDDHEAFYLIPNMAADLAAFVGARQLADYVLVAHSFGGAVALEGVLMGQLHPHALVLVDTAPAGGVETPAEAFPYLEAMRLHRELLVQALASIMPSYPPDDYFQSLVDDAGAMPAAAFSGPPRGLAEWDVMRRLPEIHLPTLLIWGDQDIMVDAEATRFTFLGIAGAANLEVFRGCGHCPMIEQPDGFVDSLVRFVEEDRIFSDADN